MKIELIYFDGCPNADRARANVRRALDIAGVRAESIEWEQGNPAAPPYVRDYGSPTVLVNGRDVTGAGGRVAGSSCRAEGAPSVESIRAALRKNE
jgi:hypothetical protein